MLLNFPVQIKKKNWSFFLWTFHMESPESKDEDIGLIQVKRGGMNGVFQGLAGLLRGIS